MTYSNGLKYRRAYSDAQKKRVMKRLLKVWIDNPFLRLSQLIASAYYAKDIFYVEDEDFIKDIEKFYEVKEEKPKTALKI